MKNFLNAAGITYLWGLIMSYVATALANSGFIASSTKGVAGGVAPLDMSGRIDAQYLPSYVDDVVEVYPISGATSLSDTWLTEDSAHMTNTPITPEGGKIYILMEPEVDNTDPQNPVTVYEQYSQFRWSGSGYVKMLDGGIGEMTTADIDAAIAAAEASQNGGNGQS